MEVLGNDQRPRVFLELVVKAGFEAVLKQAEGAESVDSSAAPVFTCK
jgi:hypothetical protein